ncbi:MAG: GWxTD domain-containing protein [candidate division WOR-3 bacterium]
MVGLTSIRNRLNFIFFRVVIAGLLMPLTAMGALVTLTGELKATVDQAVFLNQDGSASLEIAYEVPFTSLVFVRDRAGFVARFRVAVQILDRRRSPVAGDVWEHRVATSDYQETVARDSTASGLVEVRLPANAHQAVVEVSDLASDRVAAATFPIRVSNDAIAVRVRKAGDTNPSRVFRLHDTIEVLAELLNQSEKADSGRFTVKKGHRVVTGGVVAFAESAGRSWARWSCPVAESGGPVRLGSGEYQVEVRAIFRDSSLPLGGRTMFRVELPLFYDDSAYLTRVDQLLYIATPEEQRRLRNLPRQEREQAWHEFWRPKDTDPTTEFNEAEQEYFERIEFAEEHFGRGDKGYRSDRGRVYVRFGPPDQIEQRPFEIDRPAEEIWFYYSLNRRFIFVDRFGSGQFVLMNREALDVR